MVKVVGHAINMVRKLHIDVSNGLIVANYLSEDRKPDAEIAPHLIKQVGKIDSITDNKGYDQSRVYEAANDQLKGVVKSTSLLGQMQLFLRQMKQHLNREISI